MKGDTALLEPGGHVLVVDDEEPNRELLEEILAGAGYRVSLAADGERALRTAEQGADCIVLDVMMPRLDGYEVCRRLKADPLTRFIPVVMLTALAEVSDRVRGLEAGADDFLNKPVKQTELLSRVRSLVKIKRLRDELDTSENLIVAMVRALENKDRRAAGHSERVAASALATATLLGLPPHELAAVGHGALLHDIGKLGVPEELLWSGETLAGAELAAYQRHPELGERILSPLRSLRAALDVVRHHHEHLDGSGYPDGLAGSALLPPAEIVAVANLYDNLRHLDGLGRDEAALRLDAAAAQGLYRRDTVSGFLRAGVAALGTRGRSVFDPWQDLAPVAAAFTSGRILLADDSEQVKGAIRAMLEGAGFPVVEVTSGDAVVEAVRSERPDLVLIDSRMPGVDGFALCQRLKGHRDTEFLPLILIGAEDERRTRTRGVEAGADDYLALPLDRTELLARVRSLLRLRMYHRDLEDHQAVVLSLASVLEAKDPYTRGHSARVGELAFRLAREMGLPPDDCDQMKVAGLLHDIGKVGVSEQLINRPGPLTEEERRAILKHPAEGETICRPLRTVRAVLPLIRSHHERWDGKGYPDGIAGEAIPIGARVLAIADAFDALTSDRSYRKSSPPEEALAILARETEEGHWDPRAFEALRGLIRREGA